MKNNICQSQNSQKSTFLAKYINSLNTLKVLLMTLFIWNILFILTLSLKYNTSLAVANSENSIETISSDEIIWDTKYFRSSHKNKVDLRNVTADLVTGISDTYKKVKGIKITRWPLPENKRYDFSIRYESKVYFSPGSYIFSGQVNDGVRTWVDGKKVLDFYKDRALSVNYSSDPIFLSGDHFIEVEYYQMYEDALLTFSWKKAYMPVITPTTTPTPVPSTTYIPMPAPTLLPSPVQMPSINPDLDPLKEALWDVKYFRSNHKSKPDLRTVTADMVTGLSNNFTKVKGIGLYKWPLPESRRYDFSIRYTANIAFNGNYVITGKANDGVRIWVDGKQVLNEWKDRPSTIAVKSIEFTAHGSKSVEVEYFQKYEDAYLELSLEKVSPNSIPQLSPTTQPININCTTGETYRTITLDSINDRDPAYHADLNISLRGWTKIDNDNNLKSFITYNGPTDIYAPNFYTLFEKTRSRSDIVFSSVYKINDWVWQNAPNPGHAGSSILTPNVTMTAIKFDQNEPVRAPKSKLFAGLNNPIVLYADSDSITLNYTNEDSVANGYAVHFENICVDKNLLALYNRVSPASTIKRESLPLIISNQKIGLANNSDVYISITDKGTFLDPRSEKDWWQ